MYRLQAKVIFNGEKEWVIEHISEVEIVRDMESLTDTCKIMLPKRMKWNNHDEIPLRQGDKVEVSLGYDDRLELAFVGYIRQVGFKPPILIECEDEMYRLKMMPTKKLAYRSVTIEQLLKDQGLSYDIRVLGEQSLGQYRIKNDTIASLLGELKEQGIKAFFRYEEGKPILYAGVLFEQDGISPTQVFSSGVNIIDDSSLKQEKAEVMRIKVKAISIMPNNKKIKLELGDKDGELRTIHTYNKEKAELKAWAEQEIKRLKRDGLSGSFTTFGYKLIDKMEVIGLKIEGKRQGLYLVKKNTIKYGSSGYRQEIELGTRVGG